MQFRRNNIRDVIFFSCVGLLVFFSSAVSWAQQQASYSQQVYIMKALKSDLTVLGVVGNSLTDNMIENFVRAGMGQGVKVFVARPKDAREIAQLYKKLVEEKKVQMLWLPDPNDRLMLSVGFEYLRETTVIDQVGLWVPQTELVAQGALGSVIIESGKLKIVLNQRIAEKLSVKVPTELQQSITIVMR